MGCDILSLNLYSSGRDVDIIEPLLVYLEKRYNLKVIRANAYNYAFELIRYRPKLLILPNATGSAYLFYASKLAYQLGILVVTLESEGNHSGADVAGEEFAQDNFFGINTDKKMYENLHFVWNDGGLKLAKLALSDAEYKRVKCCGSTLFDKYMIFQNEYKDKDTYFLQRGIKPYSKICLITTWCFSLCYGGFFENNKDTLVAELGGGEWIDFHKNNGLTIRDIYEDIIKKYSDVMFLVKIHPAEKDYYEGVCPYSEYYGLEKYDNVLVVEPYTDNILDLIRLADVVVSYDSTTGMEAWLMETPVIFINPITEKFPRARFYKGVVIANNYEELDKYLCEVFTTGKLRAFEEKKCIQDKIGREVMSYCDGKNHIRVAESIWELMKGHSYTKKKLSVWGLQEIVKGLVKKIINYHSFEDRYDMDERNKYVEMYNKALEYFYKKYGYDI